MTIPTTMRIMRIGCSPMCNPTAPVKRVHSFFLRLIMSFVAIFVFLTKFVALNHTYINPKLFPFCILLHFNTFYPVCDSNNEIANVAWMMSIQRKNSHVIL